MAKNKYKFGKSEIDLEQYINELGSNVDSYLESTGWGEEQKKQFRDAYNQYMEGFQAQNTSGGSRFYTNDFGDIYDTEGKLGSQDGNKVISFYYDNKGQRITPDEYNQLKDNKKKKYRAFSATSSFANYAKKVGKKLASAQSKEVEKSDNKFNFAKHGFLPTWQRELLPAGGEWDPQPFLDMDPANEDGTRGTTGRAANLAKELQRYMENLGDYDYSDTPYKTKEEFKNRIQTAIDYLANGYDSSDTIVLNKIGIGNDFLKGYFQTGQKKEPISGIEQEIADLTEAAEEAEKQQALEKKKYELERDAYFRNQKPFQSKEPSIPLPLSYNRQKTVETAIKQFNADPNNEEAVKEAIRQYVNIPLLSRLIRGKGNITLDKNTDITAQHITNNLDLAAQSNLFLDPMYLDEQGNSILPGGYYVLPGSEDYDNWTYIAYNPNTRQYQEQSMLLNEELKKRMAYAGYDKRNKKSNEAQKHQLGGIFKDMESRQKETQEEKQKIEQKSYATGRTREQIENDQKPHTEWSRADLLRLGAIGGDIASLIASMTGVGSVASAGIGMTSTAANQAADMAEGMGFWESLGNNAVSYGLDVLSLIPFARAAKIPKTIKAIAGFAPKLMAIISTAQGISNAPEITKSLSKLNSSEPLTVEDWRNIANGIQIVLGGTAATHRASKAKSHVDAARTNDEWLKTEQGYRRISEQDMKKLREAATIEEQNAILSPYKVTLAESRKIFGLGKGKGKADITSENYYYDFDKPVTTYSGDLPIQYTFSPGEKWLGTRTMPSLNMPAVRNVYNRVIHPQAYNRAKGKADKKSQQQPNFDKLRQLSSQTGDLTPQEIAIINRQRAKQGKGKLTEQEIQALNQRRQNRREDDTNDSFLERYWRYKMAKREGKFTSVEDDIKRAKDELAEATLNTPKNKQILANQIADQRVELAVAKNADNVRTQQLRELAARIQSRQIPDIPQVPLRGAAYASKEKYYNEIFSDDKYYPTRVVTIPQGLQLVPKIPRKPSKTQHDAKQKKYNELFQIESTESSKGSTKSPKGITRAKYKEEANAQKAAQEYINEAKKKSKEKELAKNMARVKRELPHKQTDKKKKTSRDDKRTVKREEGGILKFQDGGNTWRKYLTEPDSNDRAKDTRTWDAYYNFDQILDQVPSKITLDASSFVKSMNALNDIRQKDKLGFGKNLNERGYQAWNEEFNKTGFNDFFGYNADVEDYLGPTTYNRQQLINKLQTTYNSVSNALDINGNRVYYTNGIGWMAVPKEELEEPEETQNQEVKPRVAVSGEDAVAKEAKQATSRGNGLNALGALRLWLANRANKRMTKLALDSQQPMYLNPVQSHRYVQSDLSAEMAGQDAMARLMNWSSKPMTSDISQNFAQQMDAMVKGLDYVNQSRRQSNATLREMAEKAWLQEQQNALSRNQIHNQNLASAYQTMQNKSAIQQAFENKQFTNWDTFLKQMEYDKLVANREKKAREDAMAQKQFSKDVTDNLAAYDPKLSREAVQLYQDVQNGIKNPSTLSREETQLLRQATASANEAMDKLYSQRYGLARQYFAKKGGKLDPNKDLDRFYKYLDSVMNRNEKALDRVSKSMYALYKRKSK